MLDHACSMLSRHGFGLTEAMHAQLGFRPWQRNRARKLINCAAVEWHVFAHPTHQHGGRQ